MDIRRFVVTESFIGDHSNVNTPLWIDSLIKSKRLMWSNSSVRFRDDSGNSVSIGAGDVFVKVGNSIHVETHS